MFTPYNIHVLTHTTCRRSACCCLSWRCLLLHRSDYMKQFESRDLKAFSAEPLLVYPTHYTGDTGYISDTETSTVWDNEKVRTDWDRARSGKTKEQAEISTEAQNSDVLQSPLDSAARDELWEELSDTPWGASQHTTLVFLNMFHLLILLITVCKQILFIQMGQRGHMCLMFPIMSCRLFVVVVFFYKGARLAVRNGICSTLLLSVIQKWTYTLENKAFGLLHLSHWAGNVVLIWRYTVKCIKKRIGHELYCVTEQNQNFNGSIYVLNQPVTFRMHWFLLSEVREEKRLHVFVLNLRVFISLCSIHFILLCFEYALADS